MPKTVLVEVRSLKSGTRACEETEALFRHSGLKNIQCKEIAALYKLIGALAQNDVKKISEEILSDPVAQKFTIDARPANSKTLFIDVWYKPGVTDAVGDSVLKAARDLGVRAMEQSFSGTRYELRSAKITEPLAKKIEGAANKYLLNPLVQECKLTK